VNSYTFRVPVRAWQDATVEAASQEEALRLVYNGDSETDWDNTEVDGIDGDRWDNEVELVAKIEDGES
jgi:hypothetical protein